FGLFDFLDQFLFVFVEYHFLGGQRFLDGLLRLWYHFGSFGMFRWLFISSACHFGFNECFSCGFLWLFGLFDFLDQFLFVFVEYQFLGGQRFLDGLLIFWYHFGSFRLIRWLFISSA